MVHDTIDVNLVAEGKCQYYQYKHIIYNYVSLHHFPYWSYLLKSSKKKIKIQKCLSFIVLHHETF